MLSSFRFYASVIFALYRETAPLFSWGAVNVFGLFASLRLCASTASVSSVVCILFLLSGCALPRLIILKDPLTPEEHINLGVAYERQGELDQAIKEYKSASRNLPAAYLYLGNACFQKKDWAEAEKNYRKAIQKEPQKADAYNNLAWLYYTRKKQLPEAEALAQKAVDLNPVEENFRDTLENIRRLMKTEKEKGP